MPARPRRAAGESGFTLIEVLVSTIVLGIIAAGVATAIALFFRTAEGTASRLALSHDSQLLATYLVPDLDNLTCPATATAPCGQPTIVPSDPPSSCPVGSTSFRNLTLQYTDVSTGQSYRADYNVSDTSITRVLTQAGQPANTISVVHNLKAASAACFSTLPKAAPWTMTVTTGRPGLDNTNDFTFSVTGGGRVTVTTPATAMAPKLCGPKCLVALDTNGDGKVDQVIATFDQPLNLAPDTAGTGQWTLVNPPIGVTLQRVAVSGNRAILTLGGGTNPDTAALGFAVRLAADPNGIRNEANQPAAFGETPVSDWMAPVPLSMVSRDNGNDGKVDHVMVTFSEDLDSSYRATAPWVLSGVDATLQQVVVQGSLTSGCHSCIAWLILNAGTTVDTVLPDFRVALKPGGIQDLNGNQASFSAMPVSDGMAPVPTLIVSKDTKGDGKVDQVVVTFSEQLATPYSAGTAPWTLSGQPPGVTLQSVAVAGKAATLTLNQGSTVDTAASGFQVALAPDPAGIRDGATPSNQSSFGALAVADGMAPIVVGFSTTNATGGTAGKLEAGDQLTLTFSEPLAVSTLPVNPTLTLTPGQNRTDLLAISGVATIDLGGQDNYVDNASATFGASLSINGNVLTFLVGPNTGGAENVRTATSPTTSTVMPSPTVTDPAGNVAAGRFTGTRTVLF